jgi:hypothetical protein
MRLTTRSPVDGVTIGLAGLSLTAIALPELGHCHTDWWNVETWKFMTLPLIPASLGVVVACVISAPLGVGRWSPWGRLLAGSMGAAACLLNPVSLLTLMLAWADDEVHRPRNAICDAKDLIAYGFLDGLLLLMLGAAVVAGVRRLCGHGTPRVRSRSAE